MKQQDPEVTLTSKTNRREAEPAGRQIHSIVVPPARPRRSSRIDLENRGAWVPGSIVGDWLQLTNGTIRAKRRRKIDAKNSRRVRVVPDEHSFDVAIGASRSNCAVAAIGHGACGDGSIRGNLPRTLGLFGVEGAALVLLAAVSAIYGVRRFTR